MLEIDGFKGSIRFVKVNKDTSIRFKRTGELAWKEMASFPCAIDNCRIVIGLQNFVGSEKLTPPRSSHTATVDNFRINAAENIIEEDRNDF